MKIILTESQVGSLRERIWAHIQKGEGAKFNWAKGDLEKADKVSVPLSKLKFNQPKSDEDEKEYQDKVDGIIKYYKKHKKVMPMLVHKVKGGYEIIDGHHRYTALKQMGVKNAKVIIIPEKDVKYKKKLKLEENVGIVTEIRDSWMNYVRTKTKELTGQDWPEYVLRDWLYKNTKEYLPNYETKKYDQGSADLHRRLIKSFVESFVEGHGKGQWEYRILDVSIDIFTDNSKNDLIKKMGGFVRTDIPKDEERHNTQQSQLEKVGVSPEPIIVIQTKDGKYELQEGWHRTTSALKKYGTYKQNAWVYVPYILK